MGKVHHPRRTLLDNFCKVVAGPEETSPKNIGLGLVPRHTHHVNSPVTKDAKPQASSRLQRPDEMDDAV